jgi:hypothetical protein
MRTWLPIAGVLAIAVDAHADNLSLKELPDHVTEATVIVDAPPEKIYALVTNYAHWPAIFSDVLSSTVESGDREHARVRFRSQILDNEVTVQFDNVPNRLIRFKGVEGPPGGRSSGTYVLEPLDGGKRTRVVASLYLDVVGLPGAFVRGSKITAMRQNKLRTDMTDAGHALGF